MGNNNKKNYFEIRDLGKHFGGVVAVDHLSLSMSEGEILGMIGPNGAGKTTVFNLISGLYRSTSGQIVFDGKNITGLKPYEITNAGIARTFQNIRLFSNLSIKDNVITAYHSSARYNLVDALLHTRRQRKQEKEIESRAFELLDLLGFEDRDELAKNLPYGHQRRLEIARALATSPRMLLLDEPAAGMNPQERDELAGLILKIKEHFGLTVMLIEHHVEMVSQLAERICVLNFGKPIALGSPTEVLKNPEVVEAYLGGKEA